MQTIFSKTHKQVRNITPCESITSFYYTKFFWVNNKLSVYIHYYIKIPSKDSGPASGSDKKEWKQQAYTTDVKEKSEATRKSILR